MDTVTVDVDGQSYEWSASLIGFLPGPVVQIELCVEQKPVRCARIFPPYHTTEGVWRGWGWVNGLRFRLTHLAAIAFVVAQAWLGATCPLTALESWLRVQAHAAAYRTSFIEHWLQRLLFYAAPPWVFMLAYSVFGALVVAAWWWFPPRFGASRHEDKVPRAV